MSDPIVLDGELADELDEHFEPLQAIMRDPSQLWGDFSPDYEINTE